VAIGIIFGATRIIFKYSLTSAYVFQIPGIVYGERPPSKRQDFPKERAETGFIFRLGSN
jgi:hypothetical protein